MTANGVGMRFKDKVVIVTCSNCGIDQATAVLFGRDGAKVTIHGSEESDLKTTVRLMLNAGVSDEDILVVQGAIDNDNTLHNLVERTVAKFGRLDILVNNSGGIPQQKNNHNDHDVDNFDYLFNINLKSITTLTRLAMPHLELTKGSVVNVSSFGGQRAFSDYAYYQNTKTALDNYCRNAAIKYVKKGIRVNNVNPGFITARSVAEGDKKLNKFESNWIKNHVPMGRGGTAEEIAKVIAFLASDEASYVTGACLVADGGASIFTKPADFFNA
ncbi:enoyl-(Acyl carrier protein) reductase domain-containing protein [Ditylenchus destructor]|nr:enoyl-(Acyl carrier protein) reductase domain-containing protein [Ditylenchus destructor]